jgi:hypothetical protein
MFIGYRIRPVVEYTDPHGQVSRRAAASLTEAEREIDEFCNRQSVHGREGKALIWGIYGVNPPEGGISTEDSIGDKRSKASATLLLAKIIGRFAMGAQGYAIPSPKPVRARFVITPKDVRDLDFDTEGELSAFLRGFNHARAIAVAHGLSHSVRVERAEWQPETVSLIPPQLPGKRIIARYVPQAWVNGYAMDIDGEAIFDVTETILAMPESERAALRDESLAADHLVPEHILRNHNGPFRVEIEDAVEEYFEDNTTSQKSA